MNSPMLEKSMEFATQIVLFSLLFSLFTFLSLSRGDFSREEIREKREKKR